MSDTLKDISGRIEPEKISVLRNIKEVADELGIHFFVMGAFARDALFTHILEFPRCEPPKTLISLSRLPAGRRSAIWLIC